MLNQEVNMAIEPAGNPVDPQPTLFQQFKEKCCAAWPRIKEIAIETFKILVAIALFIMNPAVFTAGMIVGVVWDEQMDETIDKIVNIFKNQPALVVVGLVVTSVLCLQVTSGAASFLYGGYMGSRLSLSSYPDQNAEIPV
jgi:hypothetical protein